VLTITKPDSKVALNEVGMNSRVKVTISKNVCSVARLMLVQFADYRALVENLHTSIRNAELSCDTRL
jgi:hypothetical protein